MKELDWCTKTDWSVTAFLDLAASSPTRSVSRLMYSGHKGMMGSCLLKPAEAPLLHYQRAGVKTERLSSCSRSDWARKGTSQSTRTPQYREREWWVNGKTPFASRKPLLHFLMRNVLLFLFNSHYTKQSRVSFSLHILQSLAKVFCFGVLSIKCGSDDKTVQVREDQRARTWLTSNADYCFNLANQMQKSRCYSRS